MRVVSLLSWLVFVMSYFAMTYLFKPIATFDYVTILFYALTIRSVVYLVVARRFATSLISYIALGMFVAVISLATHFALVNAMTILVLYIATYIVAYIWLYSYVRREVRSAISND